MKGMIRVHRIAVTCALLALSCATTQEAALAVGLQQPNASRAAAEADAADATNVTDAANARVTVTDDFGHKVTVRYPPQRIVSLAPDATAMLIAAGAGNQLVGTIEYSGQPPSEKRLANVGNADAVDMERLIALRPDVVVIWPDGNNPAQIATIERLGIPVYRQEAVTLDGIGDSLRRLGRLTGTNSTADRAASALELKLVSLRKEYAKVSHPPAVLLEVWDKPLYTVGGKEMMSDALAVCGARNVFADLPARAPDIGIEAVLARDPDIIIAAAPPGKGAGWLEEWKRFPSLRAVRAGRLMAFEDQRLSGLGPGVIDATAAMCRKLAALRARTGPR